jgi:hypothetical protein
MDELDFQAQFRPAAAGSVTEVLALAGVTTRTEAEEARRERDALAAAAQRRETLALANAASGNPLARRSQAMAETANVRDRVRDLEAQLGQARRDLTRSAANLDYWEGAVAEVMTAAAPPPSDDPMAQANRMAHAAFVEATRAGWEAVQAGTPQRARRPKGHGGHAVRSEGSCVECEKVGATPEEAFAIHHPELLPPMEAMEGQTEQAERRYDSDYGMLVR